MDITKAIITLRKGNKKEVADLYAEIARLDNSQDVNSLITLYHYSSEEAHVIQILNALKRINSQDALDFISLPEVERKSKACSQYHQCEGSIIDQLLSPVLCSANSGFISPAWEYCVVGPIKCETRWSGNYPEIIRFTDHSSSLRVEIDIAKQANEIGFHETELLKVAIARLGSFGWEMVGFAPVESSHGTDVRQTMHYIYFKRHIH